MTYPEVLARLVGARRFGVKLGLDRMRALLDALGKPDERLGLVIHVGGTNGKGSVVAMIAALARAAGKRVATYTSPHLSTLRERVTIDGEMVGEDPIVAAYERAIAAGGGELTFFEQITAIAMLIIADAGVDVTVLEVGLGGRLDATNVVAAPIAIVTGVAMDHEAILGDTLLKIAAEKAGIFKAGQHVIVGASGEEDAWGPLLAAARAAGAARIEAVRFGGDPRDRSFVSLPGDTLASTPIAVIHAPGPATNLLGEHQRANSALAVAAIRAAGIAVVENALMHVVHPGRFERAGELILDGAHNPHGARALATALRALQLRPVLVLAVSADKDVRAIVGALAADVIAIVATRYQQDRTLDPDALAAVCRELVQDVRVASDLRAAVELARTLGSPILVAGSLFIVGEARVAYLGAPADPVAVSDPPASTS